MQKTDKLARIRNRWAQMHGVNTPAAVVAEEAEPDADIAVELDEAEAVDLDAIRGGSEEWAAGLAVYGD